MSQNGGQKFSINTKYGGVSYEKESENTFKYGCKWGCGRENVCSKPGNSCGRAGCNEAYKNRSLKEKIGAYIP
jgi:hypothetical protein